MCGFTLPSLTSRHNASILGFMCRLLDDEGQGNLQTFQPTFKTDYTALIQLAIFVFRTSPIFEH